MMFCYNLIALSNNFYHFEESIFLKTTKKETIHSKWLRFSCYFYINNKGLWIQTDNFIYSFASTRNKSNHG